MTSDTHNTITTEFHNMLDSSTMYLIIAMAGFLFIAVVMVHQHNNADIVRRKTGEVEDYIARMARKVEIVEHELIDLKIRIDELDEEIESYKGEA